MIESMGIGKYLSFCLYREAVRLSDGRTVKDLNMLGRPIERCILIDNAAENFRLNPNNGVLSKTWKGDINDKELKVMAEVLNEAAGKESWLQEVRSNMRRNDICIS